MALSELIAQAIEAKQGNKEFALFWYGTGGYQHEGGQWSAQIGNTCQWVGLGEADPEVEAAGATPEDAVVNLLAQLTPTP